MRCRRLTKSYVVTADDMSEYLLKKDDEDSSWNLWTMDANIITVTEFFYFAKSILEQCSEDEIGIINVNVFNRWLPITRNTKKEAFLNDLVGDCETTRFSFLKGE